jgi:glycosyltransferase involved in cell wall biosynthesis
MKSSRQTMVFFSYHDFSSHEITGGTKRLLEMIVGFRDIGANVIVFAPDSSVLANINGITHITLKYKKKSFLPIPIGLVNFLLNYKVVRKNLKSIDYNYSISIDVPYAIQMLLLGFKRINFIVWQDFIDYRAIAFKQNGRNRILTYILLKVYKLSEFFVLKYVTHIITQCNFDLDVLKSRHANLSASIDFKSSVLPNNINVSWLKDNLQRRNYKIKNSLIKLCFIGNLGDKRKGLDYLLQAFDSSNTLKDTCILEVIGGGNLLEQYKLKYEQNNSIVFLGYLNSPSEVLSGSDLLIVPSVADSFPNTILEALFLKIPVIGSNRGGIPEALFFKELIFELDVDILREKLESLLNNEELLKIKEKCELRRSALTFDWNMAMYEIVKNSVKH